MLSMINKFRNKLNIHTVEELGFFIVITRVSILLGMVIVIGIVKLIDLLSK